jgi:high-affinity iron transporter
MMLWSWTKWERSRDYMKKKMRSCQRILLFSVTFLVLLFPRINGLAEETPSSKQIVEDIQTVLLTARQKYIEGDINQARELVSEAYFDIFEGRGLEAQVGAHSGSLKSELESMFGNIIGLITSREDISRVDNAITTLTDRLNEVADKLDKANKTTFSFLFNSFIIIFREGFEAILLISALAAYLTKTGQRSQVKVVYQGALLALLASFATFFILQKFFKISVENQEVIEGLTMLLATAVLFYVSGSNISDLWSNHP